MLGIRGIIAFYFVFSFNSKIPVYVSLDSLDRSGGLRSDDDYISVYPIRESRNFH